MRKFYRAYFRCVDDSTSNMFLDVLLNDARKIVRDVPTCGWWGKVKSNDLWPLVMRNDGQIDFGHTSDDEVDYAERFGDIDVSDRIIAEGEKFTFAYNGDTYNFKLERLTDITEL